MKYLDKEEVLWESKNKRLLLTTHRLRELDDRFIGNTIKSIMLEELTACELRTTRQYKYLKRAFVYFFLINGGVFLLNNYLFQAEIFNFFFENVHIGPQKAGMIFYISLCVVLVYIVLFAVSIKRTFLFYSRGLTIQFQLRWFDFEEREHFISTVEEAKDKRQVKLKGLQK